MKILVAVVAIAVLGGVGYYLRTLNNEKANLLSQLSMLKNNPQAASQEETKNLVAAVSKLVVLPEGDPVVATVTDKEKLKDQPIFAKAENGDKILIYVNAKKAYIYSPSSNKIIDVVPVNLGNTTPQIAGVSSDKPMRVALYNGTKSGSVLGTLAKRITDIKIDGLSVASKDNAVGDYEKTLVIDVDGEMGDAAKQFASMLGAEVVSLPEGEDKPNADVLVIIGTDFK